MKTYSKSKLWPFSLKWFLILSVIMGLLTSGPFFFVVGPIEMALFGGLIVLFKFIFFPGQYGVVFSMDGTNFMLKDKKYVLKDIIEFGCSNIRHYGLQTRIVVKSEEKKKTVKFFSPDTMSIAADLASAVKGLGKSIKSQEKAFPNNSVTYFVS